MSNLIPEVRTDKNGNAVTRWIRSLGKKRTSNTIPAPAIAKGADDAALFNEQVVRELVESIHPLNQYEPESRLASKIWVIAEKDLELLQRITRAVRDNDVESEYWLDKLHHSENFTRWNPALEKELRECRMALAINPLVRRVVQHDPVSYMHKIEPTLYLDALITIMEDGNITNPSEELCKAVTIINYIKQSHRDNWEKTGGFSYDSLAADAAYIADHLDQVEDLLPELRARETHDRNAIEIMLNNDVQVLRNGEL